MAFLTKVELRELVIPLKFPYVHVRNIYRNIELLLCIAYDDNGNSGLGEAVPMAHVPAETCNFFRSLLRKIAPRFFGERLSVQKLRELMPELARDEEGHAWAPAFCALECALLDLLGKSENVPVHALMGAPAVDRLAYSASFGLNRPEALIPILASYRSIAYKNAIVEVGDGADVQRIRMVRKFLGEDVSLFAHAHRKWDKIVAAKKTELLQDNGISAVAEPLMIEHVGGEDDEITAVDTIPDDAYYENCAWLRRRSALPLIADESATTIESVKKISEHGSFDTVTVSPAKCGGWILASEVVAALRAAKIPFGIGGRLGESAVSSSFAANFAFIHGDQEFIDGFGQKFLYRPAVISSAPTLTADGILPLTQDPGLGVSFSRSMLDAVTVRTDIVGR